MSFPVKSFKNNAGWFVIPALAIVPLVIWFFLKPISERFVNAATTLTSLGQMSSLAGIAFFASVLILSSRLKFFEDYFGGLNRQYLAHHTFGGIAFILLLFHPLLLAGKYLMISARSAAFFLLPSSDWPINFGIIALTLLIICLTLTFFGNLPYRIWKYTHKFLGVAFFFASLHAFFIPSDISRSPILKAYILGLCALGLTAYLYRAVLGRFLVRRFTYAVERVRLLNDAIVEIEMRPQDRAMEFSQGQFVFISFQQGGISREVHPFSITSSPVAKNVAIAVKSLGDYTLKLKNLKAGAVAKIEGPFGKFAHKEIPGRDQIWIAGGIGITPFVSMARSLNSGERPSRRIDLYYCTGNESEAVFLNELNKIASRCADFKVIPIFSETQGRLETHTIEESSGELTGKEIFLCGPPPMMASLKKQFLSRHVEPDRIHSEEFQLV